MSMKNDELKIEQTHLTKVYNKLLEKKKELEDQIASLNAKAVDDKNDIRDNMRFDYADIETAMETLAELEVWNRYIDTYNVESDSLSKRLSTVNKLLEAPYFAKIELQFDPSEEPESYYIGRAAISDGKHSQMIVDWRSPIAEVYYNQDMGHTHYTVEDRQIPVDLKLRRQFDLYKDKLNSYFDTQIAIEDPMLLKSLSQTHSDKMQAITATIQKEQNTIIRYPDMPVLLVEGIAGSGKTSVLLQRIAYLFYQKRKTLRPDQVCLMTLNPVFRDYIDNVLPDMGETNPLTLTWREFLEMVNAPYADDEYDYTEAESLDKIHDTLPLLTPEADYFQDIYQKEKLVMSKNDILNVVKRYSQFPMGVRLIQTVADTLEEKAKAILRENSDNESGSFDSVAKSDSAEENRMENDYGGALNTIRHCGFVNAAAVASRILGRNRISAAEWLFTKMELTGLCDRNMRYVMIDEVQDYSKAQLMVFMRFFPSARFMLLGDEFQAIHQGTVTFDEIEKMAEEDGKKFATLPLMTSYRSSPEITEMFSHVLPSEKKLMVSSVKRPGEKVRVMAASSESDYCTKLRSLISEFESHEGLTAIICRRQHNLERIVALLGNDSPQIITENDPLPKKGAFLIELALAKGLEFDQVIMADADKETYPDDELGKHCLYTAMSRATQYLAILSEGELSENIKI